MPEYLSLCASRSHLLPTPCQTCAWWQTSGFARVSPPAAATMRERWTTSVETEWDAPGLIQISGNNRLPHISSNDGSSRASAGPAAFDPAVTGTVAVIHCAPTLLVPRLKDLLLVQLPPEAVVLFCLRVDGPPDQTRARQLLQEMLRQLKEKRAHEVYAIASLDGDTPQEDRCEFFSQSFLLSNGFEHIHREGDLCLMRVDLRGLLSILAPLAAALRRLLHQEPTPNLAAWSSSDRP
jgi:hypothetical protein